MENCIAVKGQMEFMGLQIPVVYGGFGRNQMYITDKTVLGEKLVSFQVENPGAEMERLFVVYNASDGEATVALPEGTWFVLADAQITDCCKPVTGSDNTVRVAAQSGMILGRKAE